MNPNFAPNVFQVQQACLILHNVASSLAVPRELLNHLKVNEPQHELIPLLQKSIEISERDLICMEVHKAVTAVPFTFYNPLTPPTGATPPVKQVDIPMGNQLNIAPPAAKTPSKSPCRASTVRIKKPLPPPKSYSDIMKLSHRKIMLFTPKWKSQRFECAEIDANYIRGPIERSLLCEYLYDNNKLDITPDDFPNLSPAMQKKCQILMEISTWRYGSHFQDFQDIAAIDLLWGHEKERASPGYFHLCVKTRSWNL